MPFYNWSTTPASNAASDSTCPFPEGMSPSAVNDGVRALMARMREYGNDVAGSIVTTGTGTAYALTTNEGFTSLAAAVGQKITFQLNADCGTPATLNVDLLGAKPLRTAPGVELIAGAMKNGSIHTATYASSNSGEWLVQSYNPVVLSAGVVGTSNLVDKAVTLQKLYHPSTTSRLLGSDSVAAQSITAAVNNGSGLIRLTVTSTTGYATGQSKTVSDVAGTTEANGTWTITVVDSSHIDLQGSTFTNAYVSGGTIGGGVEEIQISTGLNLTGAVLTAPAFPPAGAFKSLAIKVTGNTALTVAADYVAVTDGINFLTLPFSATVNMATTGANALDTGSIAQATWYYIWAIAQSNGTTACLASTSSSSPTMPSGYTFKARVGAVTTASSTAQLMGTWQLGRKARYVVGLAQTGSYIPLIFAGVTVTNAWTAKSVANTVPTAVASEVSLIIYNGGPTGQECGVAPNGSYPTSTAGAMAIAFGYQTTGANYVTTHTKVDMLLESASIYVITQNSANGFYCYGWEDNI